MASNTPSRETHLEEGLLPVVADEKRTLLPDTLPSGPGYPHSKPQRTNTTAMAMARRFLIFAVCFLVSFSLASVVSPHLRCTRHQHHGDNQATLQEAHPDGAELSELVNAPKPDRLHRLLHAYFPKAFQDSVNPSDQDALSAAEADDARLASTLARLGKRQDGTNNTESSPSPTASNPPTQRSTEPSPTEPSPTEPTSPPPSPTTTRTPPPPPPPPTNTPPPSPTPSTNSPPPPPPPPPSTSSPGPPPPPPTISEPRPPTSSAAEPSDSGMSQAASSPPQPPLSSQSPTSFSSLIQTSTSSEEETTTSSSTRRTTTSPTSFRSSREVITTRTSTDPDGDITIITETSFVGVDPTPETTSGGGSSPDLQNTGPRNGAAASVILAAGLMVAGAALLL